MHIPARKFCQEMELRDAWMKILEKGVAGYARLLFLLTSQMHAKLTASSKRLDGSGAATGGGGGGGGGGTTGGGEPPGGVGVEGTPGGNGDPPSGKIGGIGGMKIDPAGVSGTTIPVVGGGTSRVSGGPTRAASGPAPAGASIASGDGSAFSTGSPGTSERRLPQRVLAMCVPSVRIASPAGRVKRFLVQKMRLPTRYETKTARTSLSRVTRAFSRSKSE